MAYAIGQIIYGVNLTCPYRQKDPYEAVREEIEDLLEGEVHLGSAYSGDADEPTWFGLQLGSINGLGVTLGSTLVGKMTINSNHRSNYQLRLEDLNQDGEVSAELKKILSEEIPNVWILWSTS